ncbi:MAG: dienelactone hydrolase family protein [Bryobacteraceae bacterium]|nr:dienelactone hydrolase family protein [Bryobacteraceae bacterium]
MYESKNPIDELVHLYVDGAFDRRELVQRVVRVTGSMAAALAALGGFEELRAQPPSACPADVRVPADAPYLDARDVEFAGPGGRMLGYLAQPKNLTEAQPAIIVIHENRGLVEHIRDVTRRAARAGFVALGVDLLSRQGGTAQFTEPTQQTAAYGRTNPFDRRSDLIASLAYLKTLDSVIFDRIGVTGFCAGGGNTWDLIVNIDEIAAAVPFYGAPPPVADLARLRTPVLAMYAERDRALTGNMAPVVTALLAQQRSFGLNIYEGVGHAFHNDTGAAYNAEAACDAWAKTMTFFNKFLRAPRT